MLVVIGFGEVAVRGWLEENCLSAKYGSLKSTYPAAEIIATMTIASRAVRKIGHDRAQRRSGITMSAAGNDAFRTPYLAEALMSGWRSLEWNVSGYTA